MTVAAVRGERYVVLGLAHVRSEWFGDVATWSTAAALPVEFVQCVSTEELRARLASGRPFSAALVDAGLPGVDRDLVDAARTAGCAVFVVDDPRVPRDWNALGASAVLPPVLSSGALLDALETHARPIGRGEAVGVPVAGAPEPASWRGALVAVTGARGAGTSTLAMALAQALGADPRHRGGVVLADLALTADQALLHDAGDVVPGVLELVDAHRFGLPAGDAIRDLAFDVDGRGYALLLGLRRHRDWAALRPRAVEAAVDGLRRSYRVVVADVDDDLEGEAQCGSPEVEDRNVLARTATTAADVVVAVGQPGAIGVHRLARVLEGLLDHGIDPVSVVPVVNRAPRGGRARAHIAKALSALCPASADGRSFAAPVFVPDHRRLDLAVHDGHRLPVPLGEPVIAAVAPLLDRDPAAPRARGEPERVALGSLGRWTEP